MGGRLSNSRNGRIATRISTRIGFSNYPNNSAVRSVRRRVGSVFVTPEGVVFFVHELNGAPENRSFLFFRFQRNRLPNLDGASSVTICAYNPRGFTCPHPIRYFVSRKRPYDSLIALPEPTVCDLWATSVSQVVFPSSSPVFFTVTAVPCTFVPRSLDAPFPFHFLFVHCARSSDDLLRDVTEHHFREPAD